MWIKTGMSESTIDSIPSQLAKKKNRFVFKDIPGSPRKDAYEDALDWLCGFGLCQKCCRLDKLSLPLSGWANPDIYKIGVCFEIQFSDTVPHGEEDLPMDEVITEKHSYRMVKPMKDLR